MEATLLFANGETQDIDDLHEYAAVALGLDDLGEDVEKVAVDILLAMPELSGIIIDPDGDAVTVDA